MTTYLRHQEWSTSGLVASISRNAFLPANQQTFSQADFIAILNEELQSRVIPFILALNENYFVTTVNIPVIATSVKALSVGTSPQGGSNVAYQLPVDAIGKRLVNVSAVLASGSSVTLPLVSEWQVGSPGAYKFGCYIGGQNGDYLYLYPAQAFQNVPYISITYPQAPLALCDDTAGASSGYVAGSASAAQITAINYTTGVLTLTAVPTIFTTGAGVNVVSGTPQFATEVVDSLAATSGSTVTLATPGLLTTTYSQQAAVVNDWIASAGYSPFLQVPAEIRNLAVQAAVVRCLQALGGDQWQTAETKMQQMLQSAVPLLKPRISDSPKVLTSSNRGIGAVGRWRGYFWRG